MMDYTAGFLFHNGHVLLVQKTRPKWQAGLLNAIGGKLDDGEQPLVGMIREFKEETGINTDFSHFATERGRDYTVHFFRSEWLYNAPTVPITNDVGERLLWCPLPRIGMPMVGNLHWLIPLAQDWRAPFASVCAIDHDIVRKPYW